MRWIRRGAGLAGTAGRWAVAVFVVVAVASALVAVGYVVSARSRDRTLLATQGQTVSLTVEGLVDHAVDHATAISALYGASDHVTEREFLDFVAHIGLTEGMFGVGFIRVIGAAELPAFERALSRSHPEAFVFEVDGIEQRPVGAREEYYPIEFFYSVDELPAWGFDAATDPEFAGAVDRIRANPVPTASGMLAFPGRPDLDGWVMFEPAFNGSGAFVGVVATAMDLGEMLAAAAPMGVGSSVDLRIVDLSAGGAEPPAAAPKKIGPYSAP